MIGIVSVLDLERIKIAVKRIREIDSCHGLKEFFLLMKIAKAFEEEFDPREGIEALNFLSRSSYLTLIVIVLHDLVFYPFIFSFFISWKLLLS